MGLLAVVRILGNKKPRSMARFLEYLVESTLLESVPVTFNCGEAQPQRLSSLGLTQTLLFCILYLFTGICCHRAT